VSVYRRMTKAYLRMSGVSDKLIHHDLTTPSQRTTHIQAPTGFMMKSFFWY